jgi:hypothetical protein
VGLVWLSMSFDCPSVLIAFRYFNGRKKVVRKPKYMKSENVGLSEGAL